MGLDLARIFKAYDVRGVVPSEFDADIARATGAAFVRLLDAKEIVIAHDMRESSGPLSAAFAEGATSQGADVVLAGLGSTDLLYFAAGSLNLPGAMFTASHNPAKYNGIKMCRAGAAPIGQETGLAEIRDLVANGVPEFTGTPGSVREVDLRDAYVAHLRTLVDLSGILPLKVVPLYFELDGSFPNHEANPIEPENLRDLQQAVRDSGADLGLAFDGDADRCFVVDERGELVTPSTITALVAERELAREPGGTIIHNVIVSRAVPELVTRLGANPVRTRVGHSFIKGEMARTGAIFG